MRQFYLVLTVLLIDEMIAENQLNFLILHNNDMHARFEETSRNSGTCKDKTPRNGKNFDKKGCVGGFARTAHEIRRYRKLAEEGKGSPVLYLNAGDTYVGTAWFTIYKWEICRTFLELLEPDAMSLGNHEFDFGVAGLAPLVNNVSFPIVGANLNFDKEPSLKRVKTSVTLKVNGTDVGIIGHLIPDTKAMSSPGAVEFLDVVESVKNESEKLNEQGVKIIIVLGHSGYDTDRQIAAEVPLADIVIGGHTNTFLWNGQQPDLEKPEDLYPKVIVQPNGKKVPVVQAYAYTKYLGILNVTFDSNGDLIDFEGIPEFLDTNIPQDSDVLDVLDRYRPKIDELDTMVVGKSRVLLDSSKCRTAECNFGNMIADAFVFYMASLSQGKGWTDTPIGLINGGSIRTTINPLDKDGNITHGELLGTMPFDNRVISLRIKGADLIKTLEIGARSNGETSKGEFLQVSGLRVVYNMNQPSYSRVVSVKVRCGDCDIPKYEPVIADKYYNVVSISFIVNGGDAHIFLKNSENQKVQDLGDVAVVEWYLARQSPIYPEEQGRIQFVDDLPVESSAKSIYVNPVMLLSVIFNHLYYKIENR